MEGIFIVKRPFKSNGLCFNAGDTVVPGQIKLFKSKCSEGKIALLTERSLESIVQYVYRRTQEDITEKLRDLLENGIPEEVDEDINPDNVDGTPENTDVTPENTDVTPENTDGAPENTDGAPDNVVVDKAPEETTNVNEGKVATIVI
jgi:hypothetical protein